MLPGGPSHSQAPNVTILQLPRIKTPEVRSNLESGSSTSEIADLPVTQKMRERLLLGGRARPHRAGSRGYVSYPMESREDASAVLEILRSNYERAKAAAERRVEGRTGDDGA